MLIIQNIQRVEEQNVRAYMEDRSFVRHFGKRYFAAFVFDGHNGSLASEFLLNSVPPLLELLLKDGADDPEQIAGGIKSMFDLLNNVFYKEDKKAEPNAGSTICGIIVDKAAERILSVNCGDSQFVVFGAGGRTIHVSEADSLETSSKRSAITKVGGKVSKVDGLWRLGGYINMSKVFADFGLGKDFEDTIKRIDGRSVETKWISPVMQGRKSVRIVLATDGLWDEFSIADFASNPILRAGNKPKTLMKLIKDCGVKGDNVSMISFDCSVG